MHIIPKVPPTTYNNHLTKPTRMKSNHQHLRTLSILTAYAVFGALHELAHLATASWLNQNGFLPTDLSVGALLDTVLRAALGRYSLIQVDDEQAQDSTLIVHAGWVFSLVLAIGCHLLHIVAREKQQQTKTNDEILLTKQERSHAIMSIFLNPALPIVAYITAIEAIVTDLLGFTPIHPYLQESSRLICFCGNFGVLLLNPSWLSIDGGRTALDVLEKMVNVTMMRGMFS